VVVSDVKGLPSGATYNAFGLGINIHTPSIGAATGRGRDPATTSGVTGDTSHWNEFRDKVNKQLGIGEFMN
jgi:hypothetical protein